MDKNAVLEKIKKCLRLAKSANEHEAAAALRQAQKLMELYRVSDAEVLAAGVCEDAANAGASKRPCVWETVLASTVSDAFGCHLVFTSQWGTGYWKFIGVGANADIAKYAFAVLLRQLRSCRQIFIKSECKRLKTASKTRRADLFCDAWVRAVADKAEAMAGQDGDRAAIDAYLLHHYPDLKKMASRDRNEGRNLRDKDWGAVHAGAEAGRRARLNRGVGGMAEKTLIEQ